MDLANQTASQLNSGIDSLVLYVKENGVAIAVLLAIAYVVRSQMKKSAALSEALGTGHVLAKDSSSARNATSREEELRQVRLRQQEVADAKAKEAEKLRKEKENKEKERKNNVAKPSQGGSGDKLGSSRTTSSFSTSAGYNPMQPWASHTSGYRPARRNVNRG